MLLEHKNKRRYLARFRGDRLDRGVGSTEMKNQLANSKEGVESTGMKNQLAESKTDDDPLQIFKRIIRKTQI